MVADKSFCLRLRPRDVLLQLGDARSSLLCLSARSFELMLNSAIEPQNGDLSDHCEAISVHPSEVPNETSDQLYSLLCATLTRKRLQ